jgi:ferrochelatase
MDFDALLLLSFGGPEGPEQVRPFLENVTRGRGIPPERLDEVAEHYHHFGGVSPINGINRALIAEIRAEIADRGETLPVYFGNRNWAPLVEDTVAEMAAAGIRRAAVFATSAWGGYSGCAQYQEDIARARAANPAAPELVRLRQFFDHPRFVKMFADSVRAAVETLPAGLREDARLVFTAHSIPDRAANRCGPNLYERQVRYAAGLIAGALGSVARGANSIGAPDYDVVWQSRSGPPHVPWLEPDVADHLSTLAAAGTKAVVVCPVGFVADHIEVVWDLDSELREQAEELGVALARASTPNSQREFARLVLDLVDELRNGRKPERVVGEEPVPGFGCSVNGSFCTAGCAPAQ